MWALLSERLVLSNYSFDFKLISCTIVQHIGPACAKGLEGKNEGTAIQGEILRNSGSKGR